MYMNSLHINISFVSKLLYVSHLEIKLKLIVHHLIIIKKKDNNSQNY